MGACISSMYHILHMEIYYGSLHVQYVRHTSTPIGESRVLSDMGPIIGEYGVIWTPGPIFIGEYGVIWTSGPPYRGVWGHMDHCHFSYIFSYRGAKAQKIVETRSVETSNHR